MGSRASAGEITSLKGRSCTGVSNRKYQKNHESPDNHSRHSDKSFENWLVTRDSWPYDYSDQYDQGNPSDGRKDDKISAVKPMKLVSLQSDEMVNTAHHFPNVSSLSACLRSGLEAGEASA